MDVRAESAQVSWRVVVRSNRPNEEIALTWPDLGQAPKSLQFMLVDEATGTRQSMRTTSSHRFRTDAQASPRVFRIEADSSGAGRLRVTNLNAQATRGPQGTILRASFTLSHPADVRARLLSPTGRPTSAATASRAAGLGVVTIPLTDGAGRTLPKGVYLLELVATTAERQAVRAVQTVTLR